jgi:hypothetical protein
MGYARVVSNIRRVIMKVCIRTGLAAAILVCGVTQAFAQSPPPAYQYAPPPQQGGPPPAPPGTVYVPAAPPAEIVEMQPPPPDRRPIWHWQKGHWRWDGRQYAWFPGRWVERPPHMHEWVPAHWERHPNGWFMVEGHWQ